MVLADLQILCSQAGLTSNKMSGSSFKEDSKVSLKSAVYPMFRTQRIKANDVKRLATLIL
jgi:hypothetical protein